MGLRALEVEVLDSSGKHLATHPRAYGQASTNSEDPSMQLALLCNKPASWPNSRVRDALPDPLREWLDRQDRQTRNEALQTLKRVDRESGWANAVEAMLSILELVKLFVFGVCFINKVPFVRGMRPRVGRGPVSSWSSCAPR